MRDLCFICRTPAADVDEGRSSRIEKTKLGDEIEVFFTITKLMEIPLHVCAKFLFANGNPSRWIFYCQECALIIRKSKKTYEKMIMLQNAFSLQKTQLKNHIKAAYEGTKLTQENYVNSKNRKDIPEYLLSVYLHQNEVDESCFRNVSQDCDEDDLGAKIKIEEDSDMEMQENDDEIKSNDIKNFNSGLDNNVNILNNDVKGRNTTLDVNNEENENNLPDGPRFNCEYCGRGFDYKHSMEYHIRKFHTKEASYGCPKCDEKFIGSKEVRAHIAEAHPEENQAIKGKRLKYNAKELVVIVCETCGRNCRGDSTYRIHMLSHTGEKPYLCELCSQRFFSVTLLTWHKRYSHYKELGLEPFKCDECGKCLRSPKALRYHMTAHHAQRKDFICDICGNEYVDKYKLSDHIKIHHEKQKLFECKECGEKLFRKKHVDEHRQRHSGKYDHTCEICQKGFTERKGLNRHMKYHSADFPHKRKSRLTKKIV